MASLANFRSLEDAVGTSDEDEEQFYDDDEDFDELERKLESIQEEEEGSRSATKEDIRSMPTDNPLREALEAITTLAEDGDFSEDEKRKQRDREENKENESGNVSACDQDEILEKAPKSEESRLKPRDGDVKSHLLDKRPNSEEIRYPEEARTSISFGKGSFLRWLRGGSKDAVEKDGEEKKIASPPRESRPIDSKETRKEVVEEPCVERIYPMLGTK